MKTNKDESFIRTIIVDDSPLFSKSLQDLLAQEADILLVGSARDAEDGLRLISTQRPDLVLMDLEMPGMNGLKATAQLMKMPNPPKIIIVTASDGPALRRECLAHGASEFITKQRIAIELTQNIRKLFPQT